MESTTEFAKIAVLKNGNGIQTFYSGRDGSALLYVILLAIHFARYYLLITFYQF